MRVGDVASGRAGDKGPVLDVTLVARDAAVYELLEARLDAATAARALGCWPVRRYDLPGLLALKFVAPEALPGGAFAPLRPGVHPQKAWISALLDLEVAP